MSVAYDIAVSHFGRRIVTALYKQGVSFIGVQAVPAFEGDTYFQDTAYAVNDNETHRLLRYADVLAMAGKVTPLRRDELRIVEIMERAG